MARMKREEWYNTYRDVDWNFSYVDHDAVFPEWMSGTGKIPLDAWKAWDEPYKVVYPDYVAVQSEKEASAYAVKSALKRTAIFDHLDEGWKSVSKAHYGGVSLVEYLAVLAELRMARFGLATSWRQMSVYGALDEIRHTQIDLMFAHEFISKDPQYDWALKALHTNDWVSVSARALFDGMMLNPSAVDIAIQLPFTFETAFTNVQFIGLAADALGAGDINFANMISSVQTDEARHAQQGHPTMEIMMKHDPKRAQWLIDKTFWLSARLFAALSGIGMDYYTPLAHRKQSYKEFMEEWIVNQYQRTLQEFGLKKPWYWPEFLDGLETWQHSLQMGIWFWRPTVWWKPNGGISKGERQWLREKYPRWETEFGPSWDVIIRNLNEGHEERTLPKTLPWLCNCCQLPIGTAAAPNNSKYPVRTYTLEHNDHVYHFCSKPCRQIWWEDKDTIHQKTIIERLLAGEIQPGTVEGVLSYMGLTQDTMGTDASGYRWAREWNEPELQQMSA
jgi:toluene monooxygenase system protein A